MNAFLELDFTDRQLSCKAVQTAMGLDAASVEKDLWVCWTLRELFSLPHIGEHLTFKGGTSLSKAWKLIQRFSEDIDLVVDKEALGFGGEAAPDKAPSNKQRKARIEALMAASLYWVQCALQPALAREIYPPAKSSLSDSTIAATSSSESDPSRQASVAVRRPW